MDAELVERARLAIYREFAASGRALSARELAARLACDLAAAQSALAQLHAQRHVVLDDAGAIRMAHPFSSVPLGFSVMGEQTLWWGGCAWDSFAIPNLVPGERSVLVATTCPGCCAALAWTVTDVGPPPGEQVAHFLIPVAHLWDDVVRSCGHQRLFCGDACVAAWLKRTGNARGYVMSLETLWKLAAHWYDGRLDSPYERREPARARDYFRAVGLHGEFWGLDGRPVPSG